MDRFQALMDCRKNVECLNTVPSDIFRIICLYWFEAEVKLARMRLFNLVCDKSFIPSIPSIPEPRIPGLHPWPVRLYPIQIGLPPVGQWPGLPAVRGDW